MSAQRLLRDRNEIKYRFILEQSSRFPVTILCRIMQVHRDSYYDWKRKGVRIIPPEELTLRRRKKALFKASRHSMGCRRLVKKLREEGFDIGRYRVRKLMKWLGLKVKQKLRWFDSFYRSLLKLFIQ